jgi:hypothetical protein
MFSPGFFPRLIFSLSLLATSLRAQDHVVTYNTGDAGVSAAIANWGYDTAWNDLNNIQRSVIFMGTNVANVVRVVVAKSSVLTNGSSIWNSSLSAADQLYLSNMVNEIRGYTPNAKWYLYADGVSTNWYISATNRLYPDRFAALWAANVRYLKTLANTPSIPWIDLANEPDYTPNTEGSALDYYNTLGYLQTNSDVAGKIMGGCATLNSDQAQTWFNTLLPRATLGSTHNLAGSCQNYVNFLQSVTANNAISFEPEVHNVGECIIGANYGLDGVIWWGAAELARGQFAQACQGSRLGYSEDQTKWTAATVYRAPSGKVQAFAGAAERTALTTTYQFFSKDRDVFYDGDGPRRDYNVTLVGSPTYGAGNDNERVVNITWGADVQPAINGRYLIVNRNSGKVLEVPGSATGNGVQLAQNTYTNGLNQQWDVNLLPSTAVGDLSYYTVKAAHDGVTMDLNNYSYALGAAVQQWNGGTNTVEQWFFQYTSNGWFKIKSRWSGKLIGVNGASTANGAVAVQWDDTGTLDQQWRLMPAGVTSYDFVAPAAPTQLTAIANAVSVQLNWKTNSESDFASYTVLRSTTNGGPYDIIARGLTTNSFTDKFANQPKNYYYVVQAVDKSLNTSANSAQVVAQPTGAKALIARYSFDGNLSDSSGNANHPIVTNGTPAFTTGKFGSALTNDGSSQSLLLPANMLAGVTNFTFAAWVYWNGGGAWQRIFDFGNDTTQYMFLSPSSGSGTLRFAITTNSSGGEQIVETSVLPIGSWQHVAVTRNGNTVKLYKSGIPAATNSATTIMPASFNPALNYLGKSQWSDPLFNGRLDEVNIFNYALSDAEIARLTNNVPPPPATPTILSASLVGNALNFNWPSNYIGCRLESNSVSLTASNTWFTVSNSASTNNLAVPLNVTGTNVFFRLAYP